VKKTPFLFSFIVLAILTGCARNTAHLHFKTPITLSVETITSNGSILPQPFSKEKTALLEKELDNILTATGAKGVSAAVAIPDKGIWSSARGITGSKAKETITSNLQLYAGSISKIFTAVVTLKLSEEGKLSLLDPVAKWFPEISWASRVTINHLLTHTSGISSFDNPEEYESNTDLYRIPEKLLSYVTKKELLFEPGKHFAYSNTGYLMLGIIIKRVTGRSYKEAVERYITDKINLSQTDVITTETMSDLIVKGHHKGKVLSETENSVVPFAAGSIAATPRDLIVFLQALMSGRLLSKSSLKLMFSDMNLMTASQSTYYGKGVVAALTTPVGNIIGHTGGAKGFGSALFFHPQGNMFVCVMMNDDIKAVDPAMFRLMETMTAM
jgi:D-alanyl-D-alanine carboxypeptidase